jgi:hypothetical protein
MGGRCCTILDSLPASRWKWRWMVEVSPIVCFKRRWGERVVERASIAQMPCSIETRQSYRQITYRCMCMTDTPGYPADRYPFASHERQRACLLTVCSSSLCRTSSRMYTLCCEALDSAVPLGLFWERAAVSDASRRSLEMQDPCSRW